MIIDEREDTCTLRLGLFELGQGPKVGCNDFKGLDSYTLCFGLLYVQEGLGGAKGLDYVTVHQRISRI